MEDDPYEQDLLLGQHTKFFSLQRPVYTDEKLKEIKKVIWRRKFPEAAAAQDKAQSPSSKTKSSYSSSSKKNEKKIDMDYDSLVLKIEELKKQKRECFNLFRQLINNDVEKKEKAASIKAESVAASPRQPKFKPSTTVESTEDVSLGDTKPIEPSPRSSRSNTPRDSPVMSTLSRPSSLKGPPPSALATSNTPAEPSPVTSGPPTSLPDRKFETKIDSAGRETRYGLASSFYPANSIYSKPNAPKYHPYSRSGPPERDYRAESSPRDPPRYDRDRYYPPASSADRYPHPPPDRYGPRYYRGDPRPPPPHVDRGYYRGYPSSKDHDYHQRYSRPHHYHRPPPSYHKDGPPPPRGEPMLRDDRGISYDGEPPRDRLEIRKAAPNSNSNNN